MIVPFGLVFLLMLNGQEFTNTILFLVCLTIRALLWLPTERSLARIDRIFYGFVFALHLVAIGAFVPWLDDAYRTQQQFNSRRHRKPRATAPARVEPVRGAASRGSGSSKSAGKVREEPT